MEIIAMQGVEFTHDPGKRAGNPVKALDNISLRIHKGDFVAILGRNGSGKTTLARLLNALVLPAAGSVRIHGIDSRDASRLWDIRRLTGMVFPDTDNQIVGTTVEEDVAFGPENLGLSPAEIKLRVENALQAVGLAGFDRRAPHTLTAVEMQRLALAGILALQPGCIILDEATTRLYPEGRQEIMELLRHLNRELGLTILHITRYRDEAVLADRVLVLDAGHIVLDGTPNEVFSDVARIAALGIEEPRPAKISMQTGVELPSNADHQKTSNHPLLTMGGYAPGRSLLHRADPRSKIILVLLFIVTLYGVESYPAFFLLFVFTLLATLAIGRSLIDSWRGLRPIMWLAACAAFFNLFLVSGAPVATSGILSHISYEGLHRSARMMLRLILLVSSATLLTATTTPLALTAGLESLLQPLKRVKVPVQQLAMLLALALRFIPVIVQETYRMIKTRASTSAAINRGNLRQRLQSYLPLLVPLFVAIFRRGESLATAMEARCYRVDVERTRMRPLVFSSADLAGSAVMLVLLTVLFFVEVKAV
jgi:energy-coupling factor transport system ATP-binding protein